MSANPRDESSTPAAPPGAEPAPPAASPTPPAPLPYATPRSGKTVSVARCGDAGEAELICGELNAAGVPAAVVNQHTAALGPYAGGSGIEVRVPVEDADRAAEVLARRPDAGDLEPEPEPPNGSADFAADEEGARVPLAVVGEFATAREMHDAAAALGSARVRTYLPNLVPRKRAAGGDPEGDERPPPVFHVRVAEADLERAREVLGEAADPDEPRCPNCASWRVHRRGGSFFSWIKEFFGGGAADGVRALQCLSCGHHFAWGNPKGTFEVLPADRREDATPR